MSTEEKAASGAAVAAGPTLRPAFVFQPPAEISCTAVHDSSLWVACRDGQIYIHDTTVRTDG